MSTDVSNSISADTIVLVHGLWLTARSWDEWANYYRAKGYNVLTPSYPGFEVEVEALRADPSPIETLTMPKLVEHFESIIKGLDKPPILIGHSQGGLIVQILLDHGFGAAGVAIDSVPPEGVPAVALSQIKSLFPILSHPGNKLAPMTFEQFRYAFLNTLTDEEAAEVYDQFYIPAPASFVWEGLLANFTPGHQATYVNFHNDGRAPLLLIAGGADHIMPASVNKSNASHYKSKALTEYHEFPERSHYTCGESGWTEVADYALEWAVKAQKQ